MATASTFFAASCCGLPERNYGAFPHHHESTLVPAPPPITKEDELHWLALRLIREANQSGAGLLPQAPTMEQDS
jgi:hypothetical protein